MKINRSYGKNGESPKLRSKYSESFKNDREEPIPTSDLQTYRQFHWYLGRNLSFSALHETGALLIELNSEIDEAMKVVFNHITQIDTQ